MPTTPTKRSSVTSLDAARAARSLEPTTVRTNLDPSLIDPHPRNPRQDLGDLTELVASVRAHGILQDVVVVPHPDEPGRYRMLAGHRRTAAALQVGMDLVPAIVRHNLTESDQLELMLLENLQRTDLTVIEEGAGYQGLLDLGVKKAQIAANTGRAVSTVTQRLKVAALPTRLHTAVLEHQLTLEEAVAAADLRDRDAALFDKAVESPTDVVRAMKDALREADLRDKVKALEKEWAENGHALRIGYVTNGEGSVYVRMDLQMEIDEHAHCDGAVVFVSEWALNQDIRAVGRFMCERPDLHSERLAELKAQQDANKAAGVRTGESNEAREQRLAEEQFTTDLGAAAGDRREWVVEQFLGLDDASAAASAALALHAVRYARETRIEATLTLWDEDVVQRIDAHAGVDGPGALIVLALTVLAAVEDTVPVSHWSWEYMHDRPHYANQRADVYAYLTLLEQLGYPLVPVEQTMLASLQDLAAASQPEPEHAAEEVSL